MSDDNQVTVASWYVNQKTHHNYSDLQYPWGNNMIIQSIYEPIKEYYMNIGLLDSYQKILMGI